MDLYLKGKKAVVTGASQGLGRAIARTLAEEGVTVFATARNASLLNELKQEFICAGLPEPVIFVQDLISHEAPHAIADAALQTMGRVDILVNNAGASCPLEPVAPDEVWDEAMNLGFTRQRQLTQFLLPHFIDNQSGSILNITGTTEPTQVNASAVSKAAIAVWSKGLSEQIGKHGITINCLQPGLLDTAQIRRLFPGEARKEFAEREIAMKDFGEAQDVANMATFLVSPRSRYITGTVAVVDGGMRRWSF
ncbi:MULTISPECIES: SDR family NAD(P)-dependent oxidoreductase [Pantoea]|uniref:SDR family oxidoreductase n=1 Tax=Pantoea brenneri TaxID=472694 RepID=A0ABU9MNG8_9GAMM|nr:MULTISPECIES: SDR family oxidoreductase [Pantoea]KKD31393.1 3-oxoacyl-ACP reductase [Pantoea sp. 3.5.1]MDU4128250.1 SDR family oxidoreductase [Pantoea sp.]